MAQSLKGLDISQLRITENREVDDAVPGLEPSISSSSTLANPSAPVLSATNMLVKEYLREHDELFRDLDDLRDKVRYLIPSFLCIVRLTASRVGRAVKVMSTLRSCSTVWTMQIAS